MLYDGIAIAFAIIGVVVLVLTVKSLFSRGWFLGWLKGMFGIVLIGIAATAGLMGWDVYTYHELLDEASVATVSFEKIEEQRYQAILVNAEGFEKRYELQGDQWQLDARIFKWSPSLAKLGLKPGYRLDRLSGRYYSLEKERHAERTVYALNPSKTTIDIWRWMKSVDTRTPWLDALYGSATFVPMADGALYEINLSHTGLLSRPLNERAQEAVKRWH